MTTKSFTAKLFAAAMSAALLGSAANAAVLTSELGLLDLAANSGINPATGAAWQAGDTYRFAFVTSGTTTADSTDIATYNAFVQNAANNGSVTELAGATWKALGSTATVDARDNTSTNTSTDGTGEAIFLVDGSTVFATDYADLWDGSALPTRMNRTENGDTRQGNYPNTPIWGSWTAVWTGTNNDGTANADPLGGDTGGNVRHGLVNAEHNFWLVRSSNSGAGNSLPLYALSDPLTVVPEPGSLALLAIGGLMMARRRRA